MLNLFTRYLSVGVINTAIHWITFALLYYVSHADQALSNLGAFCVAVTFSFFANAKYTFKANATTIRYLIYVAFMGTMSVTVGAIADKLALNPIITLILFSALSLVLGFLYSKFIVFRSDKL